MNCIAATLVVLAGFASGARASDQPKFDVRVTNTAAESIPVAVQGTASVAGTVEITNVPTVRLDTNVVVPVRPVETAPRETFYIAGFVNLLSDPYDLDMRDGNGGGIWVVPDGKIAVIEHVSSRIDASPDVSLAASIESFVGTDRISGEHFLGLGEGMAKVTAGMRRYADSHPMKLYVPPGGQVRVRLSLIGDTPQGTWSADARFRATGYYLPAE